VARLGCPGCAGLLGKTLLRLWEARPPGPGGKDRGARRIEFELDHSLQVLGDDSDRCPCEPSTWPRNIATRELGASGRDDAVARVPASIPEGSDTAAAPRVGWAMTVHAPSTVARQPALGVSSRGQLVRWPWSWRWETAVAVVAVVSAILAFWLTLRAGFLRFPAWLSVQKADFILGPIGVGLYWTHRRPGNRFGLLLIVLGLFGIPYILESSTDPTLFSIGVLTEFPLFLMITIVILAFPSGRLEGLPEWLVIAVLVGQLAVVTALFAFPPHVPGFTISNCRVVCPGETPTTSAYSPHSWFIRQHVLTALPVVVSLATAGVIAWRFVTGTPPRRRALAIGAPVALLFLLVEAAYRGLFVFAPNGLAPSARPIQDVLQWADAATRSFVWYGFLFALIAAELFAGRVLRDVVRGSLGRLSLRELEGMLRGPLGDPGLRLGLWRPSTRDWVGHDGAVLEPLRPGQVLAEVDRDGRPAAAIVHDTQLAEDPELLQAAGAAVLLAQENAELDSAWKESLGELADSRTRLVSAGTRERRKLERDLHDGAQQRLVSAAIDLSLADELADADSELGERVSHARGEVNEALAELRELAHGIYPPALGRWGLARAFQLLSSRYRGRVEVVDACAGRFRPEVEAAMYYCCMEAVQNASKHAGVHAHISIRLYTAADQLHVEVRDDGSGFELASVDSGIGLENMRDRLGAIGGLVKIDSEPGHGTLVAAAAPVGE
jgi:signal transduction histidine kinase